MSLAIRLYNTMTQQVEPLEPLEANRIRMYVCGPTVYDDAHLGHARCYITWDVVYRFLTFAGYDVTYVRNVTDVDDKILNRAKALGEAPGQLAERYYQSFLADMQGLNTLKPDLEPKATEYIPQMLEGVRALMDNGSAYATPDGTVYYRTASKQHYGELSKKPLDDLLAGARVDVDPHKESPTDFALWKSVSKEDALFWETPWDAEHPGRPGWHMECSAMSRSILGDQLDIHAGGADLIFPHHENEIAQSEAWTCKRPFVKYWLHNGFVNVSGEKMSKSLGNFATIKTMLGRYDSNTIRYFLLTHHYRMPVDFNEEALQSAENRVVKIHRALKSVVEDQGIPMNVLESMVWKAHDAMVEDEIGFYKRFLVAMQEDFNTPQALAVLNEMLGQLNTHPSPELFLLLVSLFAQLGFSLAPLFAQANLPVESLRTIYKELTGEWLAEDISGAACLDQIIELRKTAKDLKNWPQADAIRKHLTDIGITLKDNKDGPTTWEVVSAHDQQPVT